MVQKIFLFLFSFIFCYSYTYAQTANTSVKLPSLASEKNIWVDSVYNSLTLTQKIGQLFMIAAYSGGEKYNQVLIEKLIKENGIGGVIFMQGTPSAQAEQCNLFQTKSKVPLLIGMDAEWGLGMRLTGVRDFPRQLMMGAMQDSLLVYKMASAVANQCRRMGVHIDFAPVIDVNNNPNNPVINFRSFGENKYKVANYGIQYMRGLQDNGVIACAKHFPGHGDTDVDSHKDLPEIKKSISQLESLEFYPFNKLIRDGIQSIMIAHLQIPALDNREHTPSTLSDKTITQLLKQKMGFTGLIITDALNMQGVAKYYSPGEIDLKAFMAGNDILLFSQDVPTGIEKIRSALMNGKLTEARLAESVKKILEAKFNAGLNKFSPIKTENINEDLNTYVSPLRKQIAEAAITLLNDPNLIIDKIKRNATKNTTYIGVGTSSENAFSKSLQDAGIKKIMFAPSTTEKEAKEFLKKLKSEEAIVLGVHNMTGYPTQNFGLDQNELFLIREIMKTKKAITVLFGNPYAVKNFCDNEGILIAYDEAEETQIAAAKIITGQLKAKGKLPVTVCVNYKAGDGIVSLTTNLGEVVDSSKFIKQNKDVFNTKLVVEPKSFNTDLALECCISPNALGINNDELDKLDNFIKNAIQTGAFPGCRILVAKEGKVFYDKPFGYLTQERKNSVDINTVYDIASITKVASTTLAVMKLYEQGKINLNDYLGKYLPITKGTDKEYLKIKDILTHQAGLKSWIPFYKETLDSLKYPRNDIYSKTESGKYNVKVAPNLYMNREWIDTMWKRIIYSPLENRGRYVYSDLDFIILQKMVERITNKSLAEYVHEEFYKPLGLTSTAYLPKKNLPGKEVAPSEYDDYFRHQTIQGYVHDMGAAMFGGISGHAGLFTSANDLAIIFQMLLNSGTYKGKRYLQKSTVDLFTARNSFISRRGLGFDKPEPSSAKSSPCADNASLSTFGHQGFTGTCVWADPQNDIVFIFLSNRTYPTAENKLIQKLNVREKAQEFVYNAMGIASRYRK
ncbi:MAG TPA: glycoside hydrolase family 3 N-terminal domain-containing protein [Chitinophagaceae bacterium]|nr:glycoside hydrolase family 3 N-terminal domain-containing protein [Chitinophagaceae bacterium]